MSSSTINTNETTLILAAAQSISARGNVEQNIQNHLAFAEWAAEYGVQLLLFPELSLSGYELDLVKELAFDPEDDRLMPLQKMAIDKEMTIIAGGPMKGTAGLYITSFLFHPDGTIDHYTKHFLHEGEEAYFIPGHHKGNFQAGSQHFGHAICADITHPKHPKMIADLGCSTYLASVFITPKGYKDEAVLLKDYAQKYQMQVLLTNYGGPSAGGIASGGKSAFWDETGTQIGCLPETGEGLLVVRKTENEWKAETYSKVFQ